MASIERTPFQKRILVAHGLFFFSVIFSPFYLSWETQIRYGYIISYLLSATFLGWIFYGRCVVSDLENSTKYGSIATFLDMIINYNIERNYRKVEAFVIYSSLLIKLYYAPSFRIIFLSIILFFVYKIKKMYQKVKSEKNN